MGMPERIKERRLALGLTQEELANKLGLQKSAIAKYESGRVKNIKRTTILKMSEILDCSPSYLMGWEPGDENAMPLYPNIHPVGTRRFPVLSSIACGEPILMQDEREIFVDASDQINADFVLVAKGDSMTGARIHDGDLVFIRSQPEVENGEIAAVGIGDEATLKRVFWYANKTLLVLRAENPKYPDLEYSGEALNNVHIFGKAVAFQSDVV